MPPTPTKCAEVLDADDGIYANRVFLWNSSGFMNAMGWMRDALQEDARRLLVDGLPKNARVGDLSLRTADSAATGLSSRWTTPRGSLGWTCSATTTRR